MVDLEQECTFLGNLFQHIVSDLKGTTAYWDDFINRGIKLHQSLKTTCGLVTQFHQSMQLLADCFTSSKGSTKDIGSVITRICVRQRMVENKLKQYLGGLNEPFLHQISERLKEWKEMNVNLEKEHTKETKKYVSEIKKKSAELARFKKKLKKGGRTDMGAQQQLTQMSADVNERISNLEHIERSCLRNLLVEERSRACYYAVTFGNLLHLQVELGEEASTIQELATDMSEICRNPKQLPSKVDDIIADYMNSQNANKHNNSSHQLQNNDITGTLKRHPFRSPPASPSTDGRVNSNASLNSIGGGSCDSTLSRTSSFQFTIPNRPFKSDTTVATSGNMQQRQRSSSMMENINNMTSSNASDVTVGYGKARLSSVSSHDSGFISLPNHQHQQMLAPPPPTIHHHHSNQQSDQLPPPPPPVIGCDVIDSCQQQQQAVMLESCGKSYNNNKTMTSSSPGGIPLEVDEMSVLRGVEQMSTTNRPVSWKDWRKPGPYEIYSNQAKPPSSTPNKNYSATLDNRHFSAANNTLLPNKMTSPPALSPKPPSMVHPGVNLNKKFNEDLQVFQFPTNNLPPPAAGVGSCNSVYSGDSEATEGTLLADEDLNEALKDMINSPLPPPPPDMMTQPAPPLPPRSESSPNMTAGHFSCATLGRHKQVGSHYSSSSGYSSQNTTPACSQDTIASHETDLSSMDGSEEQGSSDNNSDRFSTMPRIRGYPNGGTISRRTTSTSSSSSTSTQYQNQSNTATIRRKPTGKFGSVRRTPSGLKAVNTPTVPTSMPPPTFASMFDHHHNYNHNHNNNNYADESGGGDTLKSSAGGGRNQLGQMTMKFHQSFPTDPATDDDVPRFEWP